MGKYFGTDGVRGAANKDLTVHMAFRIGRFLGWYYAKQKGEHGKILIGRDTRRSGGMFEAALAAGVTSAGSNAYLLDICPTPAVAYLVSKRDFDCGIMISASHNPYGDNGIKVFNHEGSKMEEELLLQIEDYMDEKFEIDLACGEQIGEYEYWPQGLQEYTGYLKEKAGSDLSGLKIALDLANGSATSTAVQTLTDLGAELVVLGNEPDGLNINRNCGSTHPENLQKAVVENGCDAGLAFDGDADRLIAVNEKGELVNGDYLLYIYAIALKKAGALAHNTVVTTVMANLGLYKALDRLGINHIQTPVGDKYVWEEMSKNGFVVGGEQSGHIIFSDVEQTGDGLMSALILLQIMVQENKTLTELSEGLTIYPQLLENLKVKDKNVVLNDEKVNAAIDDVKEKLADNGRILVRPSGTEPLIRVMVEAETQQLCDDYVHSIIDLIDALGYSA
jgi:phosphoglucosamine mutase